MNLLQRLKRMRIRKRWSKERLARELGVSLGAVVSWEKNPDIQPLNLYREMIEKFLKKNSK